VRRFDPDANKPFAGRRPGRGGAALPRALAWALASATVAAPCPATATTLVNFWLASTASPPSTPVVYVPLGGTVELHVWARPAPGRNLAAFALNLVATQSGVATFEDVEVLNPTLDGAGTRRFQLVFDTASGLLADDDGIRGFQGFNLFPGGGLPAAAGVGPTCGGDPGCADAGGPAWQLATAVLAGTAYGSTELFLEIGTQGLWQSPPQAPAPDPPANTAAAFGLPNDVVHAWGPAASPDMRNQHAGAADATVHVALADFNANGRVEGNDLLIWHRGLGSGQALSEGDANDDDLVDGVDFAAWSFQYGMSVPVSAAARMAPEPEGFAAVVWSWAAWQARRSRGSAGRRAGR